MGMNLTRGEESTMAVELVYKPYLAEYRLSESHPLRPERFTLAVELMHAWGLICDAENPIQPCATLVNSKPASTDDLLRIHDRIYVDSVRAAGENPTAWRGAFGISEGDTPAFLHMHDVSAAIAGATIRALDDVIAGRCTRAFSPAGGLHHAHRDYASGFCVYNDVAIAIARAAAANSGLRVAYIDIDAHHGDGVQQAFFDRADVLTISMHESGRYLFPGTGGIAETGTGAGEGYAMNLPLPPGATDECFALGFEAIVAPAVRAFAPNVIVAQLGADSHQADPLTDLQTTVEGHYHMTQRIVRLADEVCDGRLAATGGGGYDSFSAVPRAWACALAAMLGVPTPAALPESWRLLATETARREGEEANLPYTTFGEIELSEPAEYGGGDPLEETEREVERLQDSHPLLRDAE